MKVKYCLLVWASRRIHLPLVPFPLEPVSKHLLRRHPVQLCDVLHLSNDFALFDRIDPNETDFISLASRHNRVRIRARELGHVGDEEGAHERTHELHDEGALEGPCPTRPQEGRRRREEPKWKPDEDRSREEVHFVQAFQWLAATDECEHFDVVVNSNEMCRPLPGCSSYSFDGVDENRSRCRATQM